MAVLNGFSARRQAAALDIAARTRRPDVGVMFDTWHFLRGGGNPGDLGGIGPNLVFEAQISDRPENADQAPYVPMAGRLPPGEGEAPLVAIVQSLRRASPDLVLGVEVFTAENGGVDATVAHLAETTRTFLDRIGRC